MLINYDLNKLFNSAKGVNYEHLKKRWFIMLFMTMHVSLSFAVADLGGGGFRGFNPPPWAAK